MNKFKGEIKKIKKNISQTNHSQVFSKFSIWEVFGCYEALHPYLPMKQTKNKQEG